MCYDDNANPPMPPGEAGKAHGEQIVLTAADRAEFHAYVALPEAPPQAAVIIYPDVRGLHRFYRELAMRFAEVGIAAIAIDYFGRTAGLTGREEGFEYMPHVEQIALDSFMLDVHAALRHLRQRLGEDIPVFAVGFCLGGTLVYLTGTNPDFGFAGLIPFYSGVKRDFGAGTILENASKVVYPMVGFYGGADAGIPESAVEALDEGLDEAGVDHVLTTYAGAPHGFFDRKYEEYADASADAWRRMLTFIQTRSVPESA